MFQGFKKVVQDKLDFLIEKSETLYEVDYDRDTLYENYLESFPEGTNNIYKERREYDCSCCKQFIRNYGLIVGIVDGVMVSIWDCQSSEINDKYNVVAKALSDIIHQQNVVNIFVAKDPQMGTNTSRMLKDDGTVHTWHHFYYKLPNHKVDRTSKSVESIQGESRQTRDVIKRSLEELKLDAVNTVLELINDKNLYRGEEHRSKLLTFKQLIKDWNKADNKELFYWTTAMKQGRVAAIRNTAIGTLLIDLSSGMNIEKAVGRYEKVVAPSNYQRPKALITESMIASAEETITELGLIDSLGRRYAVLEDIHTNDVKWVSGESKKVMQSPFDALRKDVKVNEKKFDHVTDVTIDEFFKDVAPFAEKMELLMDNNHRNNLVSLIAPIVKHAEPLFSWNNGFSWAYAGGFADSIKESVKRRGGKVDGVLRFSLSWAEGDSSDDSDLDAHCRTPNGRTIYYNQIHDSITGGRLDVDIQHPRTKGNKDIVENITWGNIHTMSKGDYKFYVHNYQLRGTQKGFSAEIEFNGEIHSFEYDKPVRHHDKIHVATVNFDGTKFTIKPVIASTKASKEIWGIKTMTFIPIETIMYSPNHWGTNTGNKHYFFFLQDCINPEPPRGFFNEYLRGDLKEHRKVFEVLGSKMTVEHSDNQLSGVGFNNTTRNQVIVKVNDKPINITF